MRVSLAAGETKTVTLPVAAKSLAYWNAQRHQWAVESEPVRLRVGASSADIRLEKSIRVQ
jgi:beta-glucosidase